MKKRLSICYAAPGHALLSTAGPSRNILSMAETLSKRADVTVAFRGFRETVKAQNFKVITIEPGPAKLIDSKDDVTARGLNPVTHLSYLRSIYNFSKEMAGSFDLVLEKGWRLSGILTTAFQFHNVPGIIVENDVRKWAEPLHSIRSVAKYLFHCAAQKIAGICSRRASAIIAETEQLKHMLVQQHRISMEQIEVIGLGVDRDLFQPREKILSRKAIGISLDAYILLYVGGMDTYHDLAPVIEAVKFIDMPSLELHLLGDGVKRKDYEIRAQKSRNRIHFHGQVPHRIVANYIGAADLCLAPYRTDAFWDRNVPFSTLKIPEYMACARPVVSMPSGRIQNIVEDGVSGFLLPNDVASWKTFLNSPPSREQLEHMGRNAVLSVKNISWEQTAEKYLEVCHRIIKKKQNNFCN